MRIVVDDVSVELMGDPHLGKRFVNGVPLHRRGEREKMVRDDFARSLLAGRDADLHVCMGDLFDKAVVPYEVILDAADTYETIASKNPHTRFVVLRGNHDQGRDLEARTAFDMFARMVEGVSNIEVVYTSIFIMHWNLAFFPWCGTGTLEEEVRKLKGTDVAAAFFHADVDPRNGPENLIPTEALAELGITRAFTGHDHKPRRFEREGVDVTVVGSLQPFAFGEQVDDKLYVTISYDEAKTDPSCYKDKVVRVDLRKGEARDLDLDCLQLVYRSEEEKQETEAKVELGDFDLERLAGEVFAELGLEPATAAKTLGLISSTRMRK